MIVDAAITFAGVKASDEPGAVPLQLRYEQKPAFDSAPKPERSQRRRVKLLLREGIYEGTEEDLRHEQDCEMRRVSSGFGRT